MLKELNNRDHCFASIFISCCLNDKTPIQGSELISTTTKKLEERPQQQTDNLESVGLKFVSQSLFVR